MAKSPPPRGASRSPRPGSNSGRQHARGGRQSIARAQQRRGSAPARRRIKPGRIVLGVLLLAALIAVIVYARRQAPADVATVPAALDASTGKTAAKPADTRTEPAPAERFAFYDILPQQEVLPTRQLDNRPPPRPMPATSDSTRTDAVDTTPYWLQAGAFRDGAEAELQRERIRELGLPGRVREGSVDAGPVLHRVLIGPLTGQERLDEARTLLAEQGIDAIPTTAPAPATGDATP